MAGASDQLGLYWAPLALTPLQGGYSSGSGGRPTMRSESSGAPVCAPARERSQSCGRRKKRHGRTSTQLKRGGCDGWFISLWRLTPRISEHVFSLSEGQAQKLIHDCARDLVVAAMRAPYNKAVEVPRRHVYGWSTTHAALHIAAPLRSSLDAPVRTASEADI